jgi:hypothetical protein
VWKPYDSKIYFKRFIKDDNSTYLMKLRAQKDKKLTLPFNLDAPEEEL